MRDIPADGETMGEVLMRGNNVMLGYYENPEATAESFDGGWFHSGDLAVVHPDGYIEIRDRKKDIVISGGENISSIEVEKVLADHPAVAEVAIVAAPDEKWGEVPQGLHRPETRRDRHRRRTRRLVPRTPGTLQGAEARRVRTAAPHRHRQGPEKRTARPGAPDAGRTMNEVALTYEGPVAIATLNRPQRRNALSLALMQELIGCLDEIGRNRDIRAVILAAAGKVFCSGHDLSEMHGRDINEYRRIFDVCTELMTKIQSIPQPVIAEVQGIATAAGCQLVATCDMAIAAEEASFATPGVKIGLFCTTPMVALTRAVGRKRALQMLLTGEMVDARTAADWGLINQAVPAAELPAATRQLAAKVAEASPLVVAIGKQAYYTQIDLDQPKAYAYAKEVMSMNALAADAQEGIGAFLGKRPPCWMGK